ncbi:MAG: N-acetylmannosamine-6-phosphate 2-epimerase [Candidatus Sericytochromatia bacterium]|nr:N-acetylmannosamine-6-phosphate 2-epimerase [Candidatus Sericytochromatia bacterium]
MLSFLKGKLIVSCQANEEEPLYSPEALLSMAKAALEGGAIALRANGALPVRQMKHFFDVPIIGLCKKIYPDSDVYITPTVKEVHTMAISGADIIAIDATNRKRPNGEKIEDLLEIIHHRYGLLAMADISNFDEGVKAQELGFDCVGTTLSGYTAYSPQSDEPDFLLLEKLTSKLKIPVIMEGKLWTPEQMKHAFDLNAYAVVIGSAITRPQLITKRFHKVL